MASADSSSMASVEPGNVYPKANSWERHNAQKRISSTRYH
jgi:hypothetical protein